MIKKKSYLGEDYFKNIRHHYPEELRNPQSPLLFVHSIEKWLQSTKTDDHPERFCSIHKRGFTSDMNVTRISRHGSQEWPSASQTYKGVLNFKTPFDLQLYSSLIWEMKPQTIIEFGALQGGSALWFADQMAAAQIPVRVIVFEKFIHGIHDSVKSHPGISLHEIDLDKVEEELRPSILENLPHPWLVIDDAHANVLAVIKTVSRFLKPDDYYVIEDLFLTPYWSRPENLESICKVVHESGFLVDSKYTDAFGYNATCAPNSWLKKI